MEYTPQQIDAWRLEQTCRQKELNEHQERAQAQRRRRLMAEMAAGLSARDINCDQLKADAPRLVKLALARGWATPGKSLSAQATRTRMYNSDSKAARAAAKIKCVRGYRHHRWGRGQACLRCGLELSRFTKN